MTNSVRNSHTLPKGYALEDFEIEEVLGIGGFGITYRARDIQLNRTVAIKEYMPSGMAVRTQDEATVLPASDSHRDDFEWGLDRFRKEAETLVAFRHPNIVSVFRFFRANGTAYLVMEYQDGKSLGDILASTNTLSESEIEEIIYPLLDGLEQVHAAGFMHRDIKPANIFIRRDGKPVLIDFGAARQALGGHSRSLTSIVTAGYAPYEQYESDSVQGPWSDIYALGATLYRAVTGLKPVDAPKRAGAVMRGDADPNPPAAELAAAKYSPRLLAAIDAALNVLEDQRPQSVEEFRAYLAGSALAEADTALNPAPRSEPEAAEGATLYVGGAQMAQPPADRSAGTETLGAAPRGGSALPGRRPTATADPSPGQAPPPSAAHAPARPSKPASRAWVWPVVGVAAILLVGGAGAGVYVYIEDQRQAEQARLAREAREKAEAEAKRRAEADARRKREAQLAKRNAPDADPKAGPDTKPDTDPNADPRTTPDPDPRTTPDTNPDADPNTSPRTNPDHATPNVPREEEVKPEDYRPEPTHTTVGAPGGIVGRWCSDTSRITFNAKTMLVHIIKSDWKKVYNVTHYAITPTVVTVRFEGGSAGNGAFVFHRERHSTVKMMLKRAYFEQRWRNYSTYFSRSC